MLSTLLLSGMSKARHDRRHHRLGRVSQPTRASGPHPRSLQRQRPSDSLPACRSSDDGDARGPTPTTGRSTHAQACSKYEWPVLDQSVDEELADEQRHLTRAPSAAPIGRLGCSSGVSNTGPVGVQARPSSTAGRRRAGRGTSQPGRSTVVGVRVIGPRGAVGRLSVRG